MTQKEGGTVKDTCDKCGENGHIITRDKETNAKTCQNCYRQDKTRHEPCFWCGKTAQVFLRTQHDAALCAVCYNTMRRHFTYLRARCATCGQFKEVFGFTRDTGQPLCFACCKKRRVCVECGRQNPIKARGLCHACYQRQLRQKKKAYQPASS